jgi:hypothetical protein
MKYTHPILNGATVVYRCRNCGGEDASLHCPSIVAALTELNRTGMHDRGIVMHWKGLHRCPNGNYGIADLVRFEPAAAPAEPAREREP